MARDGGEQQPIEETELGCVICGHQYVYPYTLRTCGHTFYHLPHVSHTV